MQVYKSNHSQLIQKESSSWKKGLSKFSRHGDLPWNTLITITAVSVVALMLAIGVLLWRDSTGARGQLGWSFLSPFGSSAWNPVSGDFKAWPMIYGTLITSLVAVVIAVPLSIFIAIFLAELSPGGIRNLVSQMVELLAAIPSVVYGLWGIFVFLPQVVEPVGTFLGNNLGRLPIFQIFFSGSMASSGASRLAAGTILAIMIVPTITAVTRDVLMAIPASQREASLSLGATPWETIWKVLIPYGSSGILGAVILGLGRALGETMAVTMVIGNNATEASASLLRPGYTLSSIIANEFAEAVTPLHSQTLVEMALILFVMTLVLNAVARFLVWRVSNRSVQEARI